MTEQDEKTLVLVLERYPYDDELAGIEAGVLRRLRADLARVTARLEAAEQERIRYERAAEKDYAEFKVICAQRDRAEAALRELLHVTISPHYGVKWPVEMTAAVNVAKQVQASIAARRDQLEQGAATRNAPTTGGE